MSDWISREVAIGALEDRRNKYLEDGPNWLQIQMDILTIRALPAVQPDAAVLHMTITGLNITVVKSGTVVGKDDEGNDMLVTDETTVFNGWRAWVTQKVYDALKGESHE